MRLCRFLIVDGRADVYEVVAVDQATERPVLVDGVIMPGSGCQKMAADENLLREMCTLAPLAVSTEYLF